MPKDIQLVTGIAPKAQQRTLGQTIGLMPTHVLSLECVAGD